MLRNRSVYELPMWDEFLDAMRQDATDLTVPLVASDWLEEHGQTEQAEFVRKAIQFREAAEMLRAATFNTTDWDVAKATIDRLRPALQHSILTNHHSWSGGILRYKNVTLRRVNVNFWPRGFMNYALILGGDVVKKTAAVLRRQPVQLVDCVATLEQLQTPLFRDLYKKYSPVVKFGRFNPATYTAGSRPKPVF